MSALPARVKHAIETRTGLPLDLSSGHAKPAHCTRCGVAVLAGYDHHRTAHLAITDPRPATPQQEAAAWQVLHLATYQLHGRPGRYELWPRTFPGQTHLDITTTANDVIVVIEHRCGIRLATGPPIHMRPPGVNELPDHPPF